MQLQLLSYIFPIITDVMLCCWSLDLSPKQEQITQNETDQDVLVYPDTEIYLVHNHNVFCMVSDFQSIKHPIGSINKSFFFVEVMPHIDWLLSPSGGPLRVSIFFRLLNLLSSQLCRRMTSWYVLLNLFPCIVLCILCWHGL